MPNATLCGKAVVEMVLGQEDSVSTETIQEELIAEGNLPRAYLITKQRIERCERIDSVQAQDLKGEVGIRSIDRMIQAQKNHTI